MSVACRLLAGVLAALLPCRLRAETVTLPVAASATGVGGVAFVSDVRVFNTSYTDTLTVTAVYRSNGTTRIFDLAPREAMAFDDICVSLFAAPDSVGAVEFTSAGEAGTLIVSSRLRSPAAGGFVGMFIPGLPPSAARALTVLTGLANGDSRTNIGLYNPNDRGVTATIRLFDGPVLLGTLAAELPPRGGTQVNNIYDRMGFASLVRSNGYATIESSGPQSPLFTYAAEADNRSGDLLLIAGSPDAPAPSGFNPPTATATNTPPSAPTPTPPPGVETITINVKAWDFNPGGPVSLPLILQVGRTYRLVSHNADTAQTTNPRHGFSGISDLGLPGSDDIELGQPDFVIPSLTPQPFQRNSYPFTCTNNECGGDPQQHAGMIGLLIVQ